jgi:hypothetical protein
MYVAPSGSAFVSWPTHKNTGSSERVMISASNRLGRVIVGSGSDWFSPLLVSLPRFPFKLADVRLEARTTGTKLDVRRQQSRWPIHVYASSPRCPWRKVLIIPMNVTSHANRARQITQREMMIRKSKLNSLAMLKVQVVYIPNGKTRLQ